jgi:hypothetical protein
MPRSGEIGEQTYEQVEKLVATGLNRSQAFARIADDTGRRAGTVAANYYRVARKRAGGSLRPRKASRAKGRATRATRTTARRSAPRRAARGGAADIDALANELVANVRALADAVKAQSAEVAEMRKRLDGVKQLLG